MAQTNAEPPGSYRLDSQVPPFEEPLIVFDGDCLFCSRSMRWIVRMDRAKRFRLTTAQQPIGQALYRHLGLPTDRFDTYLVVLDGRIYQRSDALIAMAGQLPWPWRSGTLLRLLPRQLRDWGYGLLARNRYAIFGRRDSCGLVEPGLADRLL